MLKLRIGVIVASGLLALGTGGQAWGQGTPSGGGSSNANANSNAGGNGNGSGAANSSGKTNGTGGSKGSTHRGSSHAGGKGKSHSGRKSRNGHTGPGDSNAGDVWVDNVGQPPGPGHEMDPHLACQDINLWGSGLADTSGTFAIAGWPPSGSKKVDYSGTWTYNHTSGRKSGDQVIAVIPIASLLAGAQKNGDTPTKQGYHFKLNLIQDPQKHKTFWVSCTSASGSQTTPTGGQTSPTSSTQTSTTTAPTTPNRAGVRGSNGRRHHHHKLVKPSRRHRVHRRRVGAVGVTAPAFTG